MGTPRRNPPWRLLALLGAALLLAGACQSTEFSYLDVGAPADASDVAPADGAADGTPDAGPVKSTAGGPCEVNTDCFTGGTCFTTEVVNNMFDAADAEPDVEVPGGMCTRLMCSKDEQCGPGGACFDATPLVGQPMKLCGWPCEGYADCRWKENYLCYYTGKPDEVKVCLPTELVTLIDCGNGTCDSWPEQGYVETHESCPRDCP